MLTHLQIRNFAIVPTLSLDIRDGFTAITGETGAGKSILVDALGLLLGERSDASWVRAGAERAELTAEFSVAGNEAARAWLQDADLSAGNDCLLRRTINAAGGSRAYINGSAVTLAQIQALGDLLVEIHGQNEHLKLNRKSEQFRLLDNSGDYAGELGRVKRSYADWHEVDAAIRNLENDTLVPAAELELLEFQLHELQQLDLDADAINRLQTEHDRLAAGGDLLQTLGRAIEILEPESALDAAGVNSQLHGTLDELQGFAPLDGNIADACQMLREAAVNCAEALSALRTAHGRLELDPDRLEALAATLGRLHDLARKHRVPMDGLLKVRDMIAARIERAGTSVQHRQALEAKLESMLAEYRTAAGALHHCRSRHAAAVSKRVAELMAELGMAGGSFELAVTHRPQAAPSPRGDDDVEIRLSANPGIPAGPLNKIASGGELSRISLAIKVATATTGDAITQIFDEVDAGIGGDTAIAVGRLIKRLSTRRGAGHGQALCVTHLAQVAVCAKHQLLVRKTARDDGVIVETRLLNAADRVDEIARMLSGTISAQSRAHAAELLAAANLTEPG
jgi:DNA repair protein RecN (Recombination protein N)